MDEYTKFKWVPPVCYIAGWASAVHRTLPLPQAPAHIHTQFLLYFGFLRMIYLIACATIGLVKTIRLPRLLKGQYQTDNTYVWVIPTVNE
jgi:hypothetical protein